MNLSAILLSGGKGMRMESSCPKQYLDLNGMPIALHSFLELVNHPMIQEIVVVCDESFEPLFHQAEISFAKPGKRRQDSLFNGLKNLKNIPDFVLVHDAARPFIDKAVITDVSKQAFLHGAAFLSVPVKATIREVNSLGFGSKTLNRDFLHEIQTPQVVRYQVLMAGFEKARQEGITVTDEASLAELAGCKVKQVTGSEINIKITTKQDLELAKNMASKKPVVSYA